MLEPQDFLDVQSVFAPTPGDPVDQHRDFWHGRIHPVQQPQFKRQRDLRETLRPIGFDLAIFDLLRARDDFRQSLTFNCGRDPVVS